MSDQDDVEASRAPLLDHLIELRGRLIRAIIAILAAFVVCFIFAKHIYNFLLIPYVWAAAGPNEFDCSGLVMWAFAQEGISLPHYTGAQWNSGMHVARADLEPGDLVFFGADLGHVGLYIGDGLMVDAPNTGAVVRVEPLFSDYVGAVRIA